MGRSRLCFTRFFIGHPPVRLSVIEVKRDVSAAEYHVYFLSNVRPCNHAFPANYQRLEPQECASAYFRCSLQCFAMINAVKKGRKRLKRMISFAFSLLRTHLPPSSGSEPLPGLSSRTLTMPYSLTTPFTSSHSSPSNVPFPVYLNPKNLSFSIMSLKAALSMKVLVRSTTGGCSGPSRLRSSRMAAAVPE